MTAPRHREGPVVGYDAAHLAASIRRYVGVAEKNLATLEQLEPKMVAAIRAVVDAPAGAALEDAEAVTAIYDRLVKAGLNLVKATDELSRLQSFLSGGPDSRPDLSSLSEIELRAIVRDAVKKLNENDSPA